MRKVVRLIFGALGVILLAAALHRLRPGSPPQAGPTLDIQRIRMLARLTTLEVPITDTFTTEIVGLTGSLRTLVVVRGDVELTIDLSRARFEAVDAERRCVVLVLPPPEPTRARINQEFTHIYSINRTGLWVLAATAPYELLEEKAMKLAQHRLEVAARDPVLVIHAREHAEAILAEFCRGLSWRVRCRWSGAALPIRPADRGDVGGLGRGWSGGGPGIVQICGMLEVEIAFSSASPSGGERPNRKSIRTNQPPHPRAPGVVQSDDRFDIEFAHAMPRCPGGERLRERAHAAVPWGLPHRGGIRRGDEDLRAHSSPLDHGT